MKKPKWLKRKEAFDDGSKVTLSVRIEEDGNAIKTSKAFDSHVSGAATIAGFLLGNPLNEKEVYKLCTKYVSKLVEEAAPDVTEHERIIAASNAIHQMGGFMGLDFEEIAGTVLDDMRADGQEISDTVAETIDVARRHNQAREQAAKNAEKRKKLEGE